MIWDMGGKDHLEIQIGEIREEDIKSSGTNPGELAPKIASTNSHNLLFQEI